ncbi:MAG: prepilin peptidase [Burkholderiales bacterium]|nr:prepilin peptidase [Burkholderiales bacterium]
MDALISALQDSVPLFVAVATIVGMMVGSFLNVVIGRLPVMMERDWKRQCAELDGKEASVPETFNLILPGSRCDSCGVKISPLQNIPVLSYLFLKGKCSHCGAKIPARVAIIEAFSGVASGFAAWHFGFGPESFGALIFLWAMIALTFIDFDKQLLPDSITLPLLWAGIFLNLSGGFTDLKSAVIGAMAGYLSLWSIYWIFRLLMKKEGMGYGDFKLLAAIGAWLGWNQLPLVILLSSIVGAAVGITMMLFAKMERNTAIPFGPYLAGGGLIAMFWGKELSRFYLG